MYKTIITNYLIGMWVGIVLWLVIYTIVYFLCGKKKELQIGKIIILIIAVITVGYGIIKTVLGLIDINTEDYVIE